MHLDFQKTVADFKDSWTIEEKIIFWLQFACLAPSAHNTQPWKCSVKGSSLKIYLDQRWVLKDGDPTLRQTLLGIGTFIENFSLAAAFWNYKIDGLTVPLIVHPEESIATLNINKGNPQDVLGKQLFLAIPNRHTNRGEYIPKPLAQTIINDLENLSYQPETKLFLITESKSKEKIAQLVSQGVRIGLSLPALKRELASLVSFEKEQKDQGLSVESMSSKPTSAPNGKNWLLQDLNIEEEAKRNYQKFKTAPLIGLIGSEKETVEAWISSGRTLERILLTAARHSLSHCISAAPIEIPTLAPELRKYIDPHYRPQVLFRLGFPADLALSRRSTRRPARKILMSN